MKAASVPHQSNPTSSPHGAFSPLKIPYGRLHHLILMAPCLTRKDLKAHKAWHDNRLSVYIYFSKFTKRLLQWYCLKHQCQYFLTSYRITVTPTCFLSKVKQQCKRPQLHWTYYKTLLQHYSHLRKATEISNDTWCVLKTNCVDVSWSKTNLLTLTHLPVPKLQRINLLYRGGFSFCAHWGVCLLLSTV